MKSIAYPCLFQKCPNAMAILECTEIRSSMQMRFVAVNPAFERYFSVKIADVIEETTSAVFPDAPRDWIQALTTAAVDGDPFELHGVALLVGRSFNISGHRLEDAQVACTFHDITGQERPQQDLTRLTHDVNDRVKELNCLCEIARAVEEPEISLEQPLGRIVDIMEAVLGHKHMMAALLDPQYNFVWVNRAYAETFRHDPSFFAGKNHFDLYPNKEDLAIFQRVVDTGEPFFVSAGLFEFPDQPKREVTYWDWSLIPIKENPGKVTGLVFTLAEVTQRVHDEIEIRRLSARNEAVLASVPDIIMEVDAQKVYTWANEAGLAFFGADVVGKEAAAYFVGQQSTYEVVQPLFSGDEDVIYLESLQRRQDGEKRLLSWWCKVLKDELGRVKGAFSAARDITEARKAEEERIKLEAQLAQAQKMESVGRLAGGVAHDFNNMLQAIRGHAELASMNVPEDSDVAGGLQEIIRASDRSADLVGQLLAFARKQVIQPAVLVLNDTITEFLKTIGRLIGEDIDLIWKPDMSLWPVLIDPIQVTQILANLATNARDAIPGIGKLIIETKNVQLDQAITTHYPEISPGDYVLLSVNDTGCGMDVETLGNVFEPFFTTKGVGEGTGLGLATVFGIVKQNRGHIHAYSELGHGSTFKIYLPRCAGDADRSSIDLPVAEIHGGSETVLLVEDDEGILNIGRAILERLGYRVLLAGTPSQAIELVRGYRGEIDLIITDVVMPEMNGKDLAELLLSMKPAIKTLFMSGYTADVISRHGVLEDGVNFLKKPFSVRAMGERIREVLKGHLR